MALRIVCFILLEVVHIDINKHKISYKNVQGVSKKVPNELEWLFAFETSAEKHQY